ncbi:hypothetical protein HJFPF1_07568 [Paramyrothecium foliicola]|nr:hypothetical protein HJFPF1_07568 [Paramyrothecium foliicola]
MSTSVGIISPCCDYYTDELGCSYLEGVVVLYGFNTISICSPTLLRGIQDVLPYENLSMIVSLELEWDRNRLPLRLGFNGYAKASSPKDSIFPSLQFLRLKLSHLPTRSRAHKIEDSSRLSQYGQLAGSRADAVHDVLALDDFFEAIMIPPAAHVTVSRENWPWFVAVRGILLQKQGAEATKSQRAPDIGGLMCWREMHGISDHDRTESITRSVESADKLKGYWLHVPEKLVQECN